MKSISITFRGHEPIVSQFDETHSARGYGIDRRRVFCYECTKREREKGRRREREMVEKGGEEK